MRRVQSVRPSHLRIGEWLVRPTENALIRGDKTMKVEPRIMELLLALAAAGGEVVTVETLLVEVWGGTFFGDAPVHKAVAQLRRAVGDLPTQSRFVATVRKQGYRLIPAIQYPEGYVRPALAPRTTWANGNPFRGLEPFRREHAAVFFGRQRIVQAIDRAISEQRKRGLTFVLCVGASGVGKSSLLEAGVVPHLLQSIRHPWRALGACTCAMAGQDPFDALARALITLRIEERTLYVVTELDALRTELREDPKDAVASLGARVKLAQLRPADSAGLVIVVDEMEGLRGENVDVAAFVRTLRFLASSGFCVILGACRSDAYGRLGEWPELMEMKGSAGHIDVPTPSLGELGEILREPASLAGLRFEVDPESGIRLDDALRDAAFEFPECLPMLQYALAELYRTRAPGDLLTFASYRAIGGLAGALAGSAEAVFLSVDVPAQDSLSGLLGQIVVLSDYDAMPRSRPVRTAYLSREELCLCEALVEARLFVSTTLDGHSVVRPSHDAILRHWKRAAEWTDKNRTLLGSLARTRETAMRWESRGNNNDLLLGRGLAVEEGRALLSSGLLRADVATSRFIAASVARVQRSHRIGQAFAALLVILAIGASTAAWVAVRGAKEIEVQRREAEHLVGFMIDDLGRTLQPLGRLDILDRAIVAISGYLNGSSRTRDTPQIIRYRAETLLQLADIRVKQGKDAEALSLAQDARRQLLLIEPSSNDAFQLWKALGTADYWIGYVSYRGRRMDEATKAWKNYESDARNGLAAAPGDADALLELSYAFNNLAVLRRDQGDVHDAARMFGESAALKARVLSMRPADRSIAADLADSRSWQAAALVAIGEFERARGIYADAMQEVSRIRTEAPAEALWMYRECTLRLNLALLEADTGELATSLQNLNLAQALLAQLTKIDGTNQDWVRDSLFARQQMAWTRWVANPTDRGALPELEVISGELEQLRRSNKSNAEWRRLGSVIDERRARILLRAADARAVAVARSATALIGEQAAVSEPSGDTRVRARALKTLGDTLHENAVKGAEEKWRDAYEALIPMSDSEEVALMDLRADLAQRLGDNAQEKTLRVRVKATGYQAMQ